MVNPSPSLYVVVDRDAGHSAPTAQIFGAAVWSAAMDVGGWLRGLGLSKYEAAFRDNGIDESVLPHVTVEDLKELGVASIGDRRKLLTAIGASSSQRSVFWRRQRLLNLPRRRSRRPRRRRKSLKSPPSAARSR